MSYILKTLVLNLNTTPGQESVSMRYTVSREELATLRILLEVVKGHIEFLERIDSQNPLRVDFSRTLGVISTSSFALDL